MYYDCQWDRPAMLNRPSWLTRRVIARISAMVLVVAVMAAGTLTWRATRPEPFRVAAPEVLFGGIAMKDDHKFHMGVAEIQAHGKDVTVLEVTALASDNVELLGAVTSYGPDVATQGGPGGGGSAFPPKYMNTVHPIGEVIPASATSYVPKRWDHPAPIIVSAGFRLMSGHSGGVNGVRIVYKVGNRQHTEIARFAAVACDKTCDKAAKNDSDYYEKVLRAHGLLPADED